MQNLFKYWHVAHLAFALGDADNNGHSCWCDDTCLVTGGFFKSWKLLFENILIYSLAAILCACSCDYLSQEEKQGIKNR
ncbi:MAG: hypothetical protein MZV64_16035 [Ignavibacteriales bacterium]|nr:hypothetical protein [Ignavibacteriales bacterium]